MSHKNESRIVNVQLEEKHYEFLFHLAKMWNLSPEEILKRVCTQALENAASNLAKKAKEKQDVQDS